MKFHVEHNKCASKGAQGAISRVRVDDIDLSRLPPPISVTCQSKPGLPAR